MESKRLTRVYYHVQIVGEKHLEKMVDEFHATCHVESIVLLSKLHTKQNIEVELEMSEMDLTAAISSFDFENKVGIMSLLKAKGKRKLHMLVVNLMRRVMEVFSTFVYKKGIAEISCDDTILQQIEQYMLCQMWM